MSDTLTMPKPTPESGARKLAGVMLGVAGFAAVAGVLVLASGFPVHAFSIPSEAMAPTVIKGDYVLAKLSTDPPHRGDVIFFRRPLDGRTTLIKRVIGLPGERVLITGGQVIVNGKPWARKRLPDSIEHMGGWDRPVLRFEETNADGLKYVVNDYGPDGDLDNTDVYVVPAGHYFVMGDNRDNSLDSRVAEADGGGFVPAKNLIGHMIRCWRPGAAGPACGVH